MFWKPDQLRMGHNHSQEVVTTGGSFVLRLEFPENKDERVSFPKRFLICSYP